MRADVVAGVEQGVRARLLRCAQDRHPVDRAPGEQFGERQRAGGAVRARVEDGAAGLVPGAVADPVPAGGEPVPGGAQDRLRLGGEGQGDPRAAVPHQVRAAEDALREGEFDGEHLEQAVGLRQGPRVGVDAEDVRRGGRGHEGRTQTGLE